MFRHRSGWRLIILRIFSYGIFLPYWGAWLKGEGHDVATVGMLLSVGLVARFAGSLFITPLFKDPSRLILP